MNRKEPSGSFFIVLICYNLIMLKEYKNVRLQNKKRVIVFIGR